MAEIPTRLQVLVYRDNSQPGSSGERNEASKLTLTLPLSSNRSCHNLPRVSSEDCVPLQDEHLRFVGGIPRVLLFAGDTLCVRRLIRGNPNTTYFFTSLGFGAGAETRTPNLRITRPLLYQLELRQHIEGRHCSNHLNYRPQSGPGGIRTQHLWPPVHRVWF